MTYKVGEKIKQLRKQLKMTQTELAGSEMTKSMLSQIENNVSNPSIKTLQYIADRLNKPISYFLEAENNSDDTPTEINNNVTIEMNDKIKYISELIDSSNLEEAEIEVQNFINQNTININNKKAHADILFKLGSAFLKISKLEKAKAYIKLSIKIYMEENLFIEASKAYVELAKGFYQEFNYEDCLNISEKAFDLYHKNINKDPLFEIELYYYQILILSAVGDIKNAINAINTALSLSTKTSIYYKTDELFRLNAVFNYLKGNKDEYKKNLEKALQFAHFTEDNTCLARIYALMAMDAIEASLPEKALDYAEKCKYHFNRESYIYYFIKGKAYFIMEKYELAYENITRVDYPHYESHKFDYLNMWSSKVYEGLILNKLGKYPEAVSSIKMAIDKMLRFGNSKFLVNAYKSLSDVASQMKDFENAFLYLKKANDLQAIIDKDDNIIF